MNDFSRQEVPTHILKTDPDVFDASWTGDKTHEIRFNDRDFQVGDRMSLVETVHSGAAMQAGAPLEYTGRRITSEISHIQTGYGLADGWVILSCTPGTNVQESDIDTASTTAQVVQLSRSQTWPDDLHADTLRLVVCFASSMANKLAAAQRKYGYTDNWQRKGWIDECRAQLIEHVAKGDPRDVANFCAFLWWHEASTVATPSTQSEQPKDLRESFECAKRAHGPVEFGAFMKNGDGTYAAYRLEDEFRGFALARSVPAPAEQALQAEIDRLMLEFCPKEMTPEQTANWALHQRKSSFQIGQ